MRIAACAVVLLSLLGACSSNTGGGATPTSTSAAAAYPAGRDGATKLVQDLRAASDPAAIVTSLAPTTADFQAVFESDFATKAEAFYKASKVELSSVAKPEQTESKLWSATSDDLKANTGDAAEFPGGYAKIAAQLKPGLTLYRWKYVAPGSDTGMAYDGLVHTGTRWVWFPKPWRVLEG